MGRSMRLVSFSIVSSAGLLPCDDALNIFACCNLGDVAGLAYCQLLKPLMCVRGGVDER